MLLTEIQLLEWLIRGKSKQTAKNYECKARGCVEANEDVQRYIADSAKRGYKFETLPKRLAMNHKTFEALIKGEPRLFDAHIMGMQEKIDELNRLYHDCLSGRNDDEDEERTLAKKIEHWKRTTESMLTDMAVLLNKYGNLSKTKNELIDATDEDIFF